MFSERLENIIKASLQDGVLTDQEKAVIIKRAQAEGEDLDEVEIYIQSLLHKIQHDEVNRASKEEGNKLQSDIVNDWKNQKEIDKIQRKCPVCKSIIPHLTNVCPVCNAVVETSKSDEEIYNLMTNITAAAKSVYWHRTQFEGGQEKGKNYFDLINQASNKYGGIEIMHTFLEKQEVFLRNIFIEDLNKNWRNAKDEFSKGDTYFAKDYVNEVVDSISAIEAAHPQMIGKDITDIRDEAKILRNKICQARKDQQNDIARKKGVVKFAIWGSLILAIFFDCIDIPYLPTLLWTIFFIMIVYRIYLAFRSDLD